MDISTLNDAIPEFVELELTYIVSGATWKPSYDFRINSTEGILVLTYFAEIIQSSGEDWCGCDLLLSTSNPSSGSIIIIFFL